jgi:GNAT superfamily N-acetyltransferase
MNKPSLEWDLTAYRGDVLLGECEVWGIPPHLEEREDLANCATVEWLSVEQRYQRQGLGKRLMAEQMRFHERRGIQRFIAWTEADNLAARKLNESMGFVYGPELAVMEKTEIRISPPTAPTENLSDVPG